MNRQQRLAARLEDKLDADNRLRLLNELSEDSLFAHQTAHQTTRQLRMQMQMQRLLKAQNVGEPFTRELVMKIKLPDDLANDAADDAGGFQAKHRDLLKRLKPQRRWHRGGLVAAMLAVATEAERFIRHLPSNAREVTRWLHWPFDERDGQWHHVAAVYLSQRAPDGNGIVLLYVDGQLQRRWFGRKTVKLNTDVQTTQPTYVSSYQQRSFSHMNPGKMAMHDPTPRRTRVIVACGISLFAMLFGAATTNAAESKPNVVFILADDLGWSDTTLFGSTKLYRTPNIERLAKGGMTFTRAYSSSPLCSPTRASVLTGLSPARHGITAPTCHLPKVILHPVVRPSGPANQKATIPESVSRLSTDYYTLAEMFRDNGYATGHFGKWHLGPEPYSPLEHGFDVDVPHFAGPGPAGGYVAPWSYKDLDHDPDIPDEHIEDRMAKEAVAFMQHHVNEPFFLNYWMFSVHAPFDAKQELIDQYRKVVDSNAPQRSPTYAAMIESMDDAVGTLLDTLDRLGIADNTIIVFASDNGGNMYNEVDGTTPTSNAPLKGGKATMYEGGVRGPAIVVQPGVIQPRTQSDAIIQSIDFYPTLLDLLKIAPQPNQIFDGISIVPALMGGPLAREAIFTYFPHSPNIPDWLPPSVSVHQGDWKLIRIFHGGKDAAHRYKLYNLRDDVGEQVNLADKFPDRVEQLDVLIEQHLVDTDAVRPLPNLNFDPSRYDISEEGTASLKGKANRSPKPQPPGKPVAGWQPGGTCKLSLVAGALRVESNGGDPYLSHDLSAAVNAEKLVLKFRMTSDSAGQGQVFWRHEGQPYARDRSTFFDVTHDGKQHDYAIEFAPGTSVQSVRIDPSRGIGTIQISQIQLTTTDGNIVYQGSF